VGPGSLGTQCAIGTSDPQSPDREVARVAAGQHGNVTQAQLRAAGLNGHAIMLRVRRGRLFRVHWSVYAVGRPPGTPLERASAAVLACGPGAALSHLGALALWGFTAVWPASFEVTAAIDRRPRGIRVHRPAGLTRADIRTQLDIPTTSPARTMLDCAPHLDPRTRTRTVSDALHTPYLTRSQLADACARFPRHPGAGLLAPFAGATADGPTRSELEDRFLAFCEEHGLPRPEINTRVAGYEVDALFRAQRLIVELDGWEFHGDRRTFESDRVRDADLLAAGFRTVRMTWARLTGPPAKTDAEARRLEAILSEPPSRGG
jgi:Protein of unknown function (DUF559)